MRKIVSVNTSNMQSYFNKLNEKAIYPSRKAVFFETASPHWSTTGDYLSLNSQSASKAILSLFKYKSVLDCGRVALTVMLRTALDNIGEKKFDSIFQGGLVISGLEKFYREEPMMNGIIRSYLIDDIKQIQVGDWVYLWNKPLQRAKPGAPYVGEHLICTKKNEKGRLIFSGFVQCPTEKTLSEWSEFLSDKSLEYGVIPKITPAQLDGKIVVRRLDLSKID